MSLRENKVQQDKCEEKNDDATERMDYEGGNQGDDCSDREQRLNNREHAGHKADRSEPERGAPDNSGKNGPWALKPNTQHRERMLSFPNKNK